MLARLNKNPSKSTICDYSFSHNVYYWPIGCPASIRLNAFLGKRSSASTPVFPLCILHARTPRNSAHIPPGNPAFSPRAARADYPFHGVFSDAARQMPGLSIIAGRVRNRIAGYAASLSGRKTARCQSLAPALFKNDQLTIDLRCKCTRLFFAFNIKRRLNSLRSPGGFHRASQPLPPGAALLSGWLHFGGWLPCLSYSRIEGIAP